MGNRESGVEVEYLCRLCRRILIVTFAIVWVGIVLLLFFYWRSLPVLMLIALLFLAGFLTPMLKLVKGALSGKDVTEHNNAGSESEE